MKIILYKNNAEIERIDKTNYLTEIATIEGYLREQSSIISPNILVELDPDNIIISGSIVDDNDNVVIDDDNNNVIYTEGSDILSANYCYIPEYNRYYYISDTISVRTNLWRLPMDEDVLMSNKDKILDTYGYVVRQENDYNLDQLDQELVTDQDVNVEFTTIENDLIDDGDDPNIYQYVVTLVSNG